MGPNGAGKSTLSYTLAGRGGYDVPEGSATLDGEEVVLGTALTLPGENGRTVAGRVAAALVNLERQLPAGVELRPLYDRSTLVNWVGRACWWLTPLHELILGTALSSPKLFADDTTLPCAGPRPGPDQDGAAVVLRGR